MKLTPKQAAARAGVSPGLVYAWCEARRLPHYRMGGVGRRGKILIESAELDAFIASSRVEADPTPEPARRRTPAPREGGGAFKNLDQGRLREAWRKVGALGRDEE